MQERLPSAVQAGLVVQKFTPPRENKRTPRDPIYCADAKKLAGNSWSMVSPQVSA